MPTFHKAFSQLHAALLEPFGKPAGQMEGLDPFATMIAVVLKRGGAGAHLDAAMAALDRAGLLSAWFMREAELFLLADVLAEAGLKMRPQHLAVLPRLAHWMVVEHDGDTDAFFEPGARLSELRGELFSKSGLSESGADAILLFALDRPAYPVDRATFRVLARHGWIDPSATYDEARDAVVDRATDFACRHGLSTTKVLKELAHGMERLGRKYCRAAAPQCRGCPLEELLPDGGPRQADA